VIGSNRFPPSPGDCARPRDRLSTGRFEDGSTQAGRNPACTETTELECECKRGREAPIHTPRRPPDQARDPPQATPSPRTAKAVPLTALAFSCKRPSSCSAGACRVIDPVRPRARSVPRARPPTGRAGARPLRGDGGAWVVASGPCPSRTFLEAADLPVGRSVSCDRPGSPPRPQRAAGASSDRPVRLFLEAADLPVGRTPWRSGTVSASRSPREGARDAPSPSLPPPLDPRRARARAGRRRGRPPTPRPPRSASPRSASRSPSLRRRPPTTCAR
jgi:hypothetical protein